MIFFMISLWFHYDEFYVFKMILKFRHKFCHKKNHKFYDFVMIFLWFVYDLAKSILES